MNFTIREYRPSDLGQLYAIDQSCYSPAIAYSLAELRWYLQLEGAACFLAENRKDILGFILSAHKGAHGHIITIDVVAHRRRSGVGTALLHQAELNLDTAGATEVWLETATNNDTAIAFWHNHGYRTRGRMKHYYSGGIDAFAMSKRLINSARQEN
ncbi:MAG TPA: N-acetyltransferase [Candidatus Acidoferrales bacterium]|nr:N-acetyltransferase [Candidatus Acidoferrales bacterium]